MVGAQMIGAPVGFSFLAGLTYFGLLRPRLIAADQAARPAPTRLIRWTPGFLRASKEWPTAVPTSVSAGGSQPSGAK
jgi:hypothetical protein